jgi:hypothetical protein
MPIARQQFVGPVSEAAAETARLHLGTCIRIAVIRFRAEVYVYGVSLKLFQSFVDSTRITAKNAKWMKILSSDDVITQKMCVLGENAADAAWGPDDRSNYGVRIY